MFDPPDKAIDPVMWKPSSALSQLAKRRCDWVNCDQIRELPPEEWLATIIVGCYYQGLADGIKHMARKSKQAESSDERKD